MRVVVARPAAFQRQIVHVLHSTGWRPTLHRDIAHRLLPRVVARCAELMRQAAGERDLQSVVVGLERAPHDAECSDRLNRPPALCIRCAGNDRRAGSTRGQAQRRCVIRVEARIVLLDPERLIAAECADVRHHHAHIRGELPLDGEIHLQRPRPIAVPAHSS